MKNLPLASFGKRRVLLPTLPCMDMLTRCVKLVRYIVRRCASVSFILVYPDSFTTVSRATNGVHDAGYATRLPYTVCIFKLTKSCFYKKDTHQHAGKICHMELHMPPGHLKLSFTETNLNLAYRL